MTQGLSGIPSITGLMMVTLQVRCINRRSDAGPSVPQFGSIVCTKPERSCVDVSMIDGQLSLLTYHASAYLNAGVVPQRMGNVIHRSTHSNRIAVPMAAKHLCWQ